MPLLTFLRLIRWCRCTVMPVECWNTLEKRIKCLLVFTRNSWQKSKFTMIYNRKICLTLTDFCRVILTLKRFQCSQVKLACNWTGLIRMRIFLIWGYKLQENFPDLRSLYISEWLENEGGLAVMATLLWSFSTHPLRCTLAYLDELFYWLAAISSGKVYSPF